MGKKYLKVVLSIVLSLLLLTAPLSAFAAPKTVTILKVKNDYARVRNEEGEVITSLRKNTKVFYLGRQDSMAYICTERGVMGYVYGGYLSSYGAVRLANVYYVKSSSLKVYSSPRTSSRRLTTLPKNSFILLSKANGKWGYIKSLSGNSGYVQLSGLRRAGR